MIRPGRWKPVHQPIDGGTLQLLFDPAPDPECKTDMLAKQPAIAKSLQTEPSSRLSSDRAS